MCRLYGFRANEATKVECALVLAQNSLMSQSRADLRGAAHPDGWGIAYYANGEPTLERRETAAFEDLRFSVASERVFSRSVVAHIRSATVGLTNLANTHPYAYGPWVFAHNGTVAGFEHLAARLESETVERLRPLRHGTNDSEQAFYWLLSRLERDGVDLEAPARDIERVAESFRRSVVDLAALSVATRSSKPVRLNFLLTDGRALFVSRWNRSLYWVERLGVHDCEICGTPHIHHEGADDYRAVVVASEPITDEPWRPLPDRSMLVVDGGLDTRILRL